MSMLAKIRLRSIPLLLAGLFLATGIVQAQGEFALEDLKIPEGDECVACHVDLDYMPEDFSPNDIHFTRELSCVGCHGGDEASFDEEVAMSPEAGFVGVPGPEEIPAFCGKCHSDPSYMRRFQPGIRVDQESQYHTSGHGKALAEGDTKVATCTNCHTAHSIVPADDPRSTVYHLNVPAMCNTCHGDDDYMAEYRLETGIFEKYAMSVHGTALLEEEDVGAPACNDCHGNHGALPPEVASLSEVCGTCHPNNQALFADSPIAEPFNEAGLEACATCHNHHEIEKPHDDMVGVGEESICMDCHGPGEPGYDVADVMHQALTRLVSLTDSATTMKAHVAQIGMDDVEIEFLLRDAHQSLIQARTLVHSFDTSVLTEETDQGISKAEEAIQLAFAQVEDHQNRRFGFAIAAFFATLLVLALFLKLRDIERGSPTAKVENEQ